MFSKQKGLSDCLAFERAESVRRSRFYKYKRFHCLSKRFKPMRCCKGYKKSKHLNPKSFVKADKADLVPTFAL